MNIQNLINQPEDKFTGLPVFVVENVPQDFQGIIISKNVYYQLMRGNRDMVFQQPPPPPSKIWKLVEV